MRRACNCCHQALRCSQGYRSCISTQFSGRPEVGCVLDTLMDTLKTCLKLATRVTSQFEVMACESQHCVEKAALQRNS
eukprot:6199382-Pleurochrysis_carterae.AAC.2